MYRFALVMFFLVLYTSCSSIGEFPATTIDKENVTIVRDSWGVPHIYGKTDADAAYGLAWASAEDAFHTMQETLLAVHQKLGSVKGKSGAGLDVLAFVLNLDFVDDVSLDTVFSDEFRAVLEAYVSGVNRYAQLHPKEILVKDLFPITGKDLLKGYMMSMAIMNNVAGDIQRVLGNKLPHQIDLQMPMGSNAIAVNKNMSADGDTYLAVNSHQPLEGPLAWYEAHVNSEEGWNFLGGTFPGGITPFLGTNEHLGWAHTVQHADLHDLYKLTMHPTEKNQYRFDGRWLNLEERKLSIWVKLWWFVKVPYRKTFYQSVYGPVMKNDDGYYALRCPAAMELTAAEQWFHMNKARNFEEFKVAMNRQGIAGINTIYADRESNIWYIETGLYADRNPEYDWRGILPGDTSATLWQPQYFPLDSLVQVENPRCGYVYNMNNTPYHSTAPDENPRPEDYNKTIGSSLTDTGRSRRFQELIAEYDRLTYEDFHRIKYDLSLPTPLYTNMFENMEVMMQLDPQTYPEIADVIEVLQRWDRSSGVDNRQAAVFSTAVQYLGQFLIERGRLFKTNTLEEHVYVDALRHAREHLLKHFGSLEIELGQLQVHVRGDKELPVPGIPEVMAAMYLMPYKDGKLHSFAGDSYIQMIRYSEEGVHLETVNCYGSSNRPESPHYTDQMELFVNQQLKPMTLVKSEVFEAAARVYHPK